MRRKDKTLFNQLGMLTSERRNRRTMQIDLQTSSRIVALINREDRGIATAARKELPSIAQAIDLVTHAFRQNGRLIYVGAGTSGRLGILDAAECPPTYGTNPRMVQGIIAGGRKAVFRSQEGAEDRANDGIRDIRQRKVGAMDVVCGIAASMRTPYVAAALGEAKRLGAKTIFVAANPKSLLRKKEFSKLASVIDVAICVDVGPEAIMGSTRMKAGTAQKMVLNMITTGAMIRLGKVYENMMVDLKMNSRKLEERSRRVVMIAAGVDYGTADRTLRKAGGHVKTALVMIRGGVSAAEARKRLRRADGFVRVALQTERKERNL